MNRVNKIRLTVGLIAFFLAGQAVAAVPEIIPRGDILPYLEQMMAWQRRVTSAEASPEIPRALLVRRALTQHATAALAGSFDLARALADMDNGVADT
jgi:hypothetical protein